MSFEDAIASYNDGIKKNEKDLDTFMWNMLESLFVKEGQRKCWN